MPRCLKLSSLLFALSAVSAAAAPQSAEAFLKAVYAHYTGGGATDGKGIFLDKPSEIRRYFAPGLANLIIADDEAAAKRGDVPALDGDPFVDAQDFEIANVSIRIDAETAATARATVRFENFKEPKTVHLDLVRTPKGWRIADIVWSGTEGSLRGLYKKK